MKFLSLIYRNPFIQCSDYIFTNALKPLNLSNHYPLDFNMYINTFLQTSFMKGHKIRYPIYGCGIHRVISMIMHNFQQLCCLPLHIIGKCCPTLFTCFTNYCRGGIVGRGILPMFILHTMLWSLWTLFTSKCPSWQN